MTTATERHHAQLELNKLLEHQRDLLDQAEHMAAKIDRYMAELIDAGFTQGDLHRFTGLSRQEISRRINRPRIALATSTGTNRYATIEDAVAATSTLEPEEEWAVYELPDHVGAGKAVRSGVGPAGPEAKQQARAATAK